MPKPVPTLDPSSFPSALQPLATKVRDGVRLDEADALLCFTTSEVLHLGRLADAVRRELHGDVTYFNINRHINPTNVCVYTYNCKFCSFAALKDEPHAWQMSHEEVYRHAAEQGGHRSATVEGARGRSTALGHRDSPCVRDIGPPAVG